MAQKSDGGGGQKPERPIEADRNSTSEVAAQPLDLYFPGEGSLKDQAVDAARRFLVPIAEQTIERWVTMIESGQTKPQAFVEYLQQQAADLYPQFQKQILAGIEPAVLFEPWLAIAKRELGEADPSNPNVSEALMAARNLSEFRGFLRELPEWESGPAAHAMVRKLLERVGGGEYTAESPTIPNAEKHSLVGPGVSEGIGNPANYGEEGAVRDA